MPEFKPMGLSLGGGLSFKPTTKPLAALEEAPDPLAAVPETGDIEQDTKAELNAIESGFRERQAQERARFLAATDTTFYCVLVFDSSEQCDVFQAATGLDKHESTMFCDGREFAKKLGIELPPAQLNFKRDFKIDKRLAALVKD